MIFIQVLKCSNNIHGWKTFPQLYTASMNRQWLRVNDLSFVCFIILNFIQIFVYKVFQPNFMVNEV